MCCTEDRKPLKIADLVSGSQQITIGMTPSPPFEGNTPKNAKGPKIKILKNLIEATWREAPRSINIPAHGA